MRLYCIDDARDARTGAEPSGTRAPQAALLDAALAQVERARGAALQRPASLPRMAFKATPGMAQPAVLSLGSCERPTADPVTQAPGAPAERPGAGRPESRTEHGPGVPAPAHCSPACRRPRAGALAACALTRCETAHLDAHACTGQAVRRPTGCTT